MITVDRMKKRAFFFVKSHEGCLGPEVQIGVVKKTYCAIQNALLVESQVVFAVEPSDSHNANLH